MKRKSIFLLACFLLLTKEFQAQDITSMVNQLKSEYQASNFILDQEIVGESSMQGFFNLMKEQSFDCLSEDKKELLTIRISEEWKYKLEAFKENNIQVWSKSFLKTINKGKKLKKNYSSLIRLSHPIILGKDAFIYAQKASGNEFHYYQFQDGEWVKRCQSRVFN